jgi:hypothetical protein
MRSDVSGHRRAPDRPHSSSMQLISICRIQRRLDAGCIAGDILCRFNRSCSCSGRVCAFAARVPRPANRVKGTPRLLDGRLLVKATKKRRTGSATTARRLSWAIRRVSDAAAKRR